jgi:hemolysin-activating ACP:hemolysin acyltransferase
MTHGSSIVFNYKNSDTEQIFSANLGRAIRILSSCKYRQSKLSELTPYLWPAILLDQIRFLYNSKGTPVAFITWAYLTNDVIDIITSNPSYIPDISEWNEGDQFFIINITAPFRNVRAMVRKMRSLYFPNLRRICRNRRGSTKYINIRA